jgi:hypothetical protein
MSSVDGISDQEVWYGTMINRPCPVLGIAGLEKSLSDSTI